MDLGTLKEAETQYTDLKGSIAIDFEGHPDTLESYAKELGIDIVKYNPVGIKIYGGHAEIISFYFLCVDRANYPIVEGQQIPTIGIKVNEKFQNFLMHLKRIEIVLHSKHHDVSKYNIQE